MAECQFGNAIGMVLIKKEGAQSVSLGDSFGDWCPFSEKGTKTVPLWYIAPPIKTVFYTVLQPIKQCPKCTISVPYIFPGFILFSSRNNTTSDFLKLNM